MPVLGPTPAIPALGRLENQKSKVIPDYTESSKSDGYIMRPLQKMNRGIEMAWKVKVA